MTAELTQTHSMLPRLHAFGDDLVLVALSTAIVTAVINGVFD